MARFPSEQEHVAPGEEQVVFSRKAGVVASKVSFVDVLDAANGWQVLERPHEDEALPLTFDFNRRGTHFAIGDESGRVEIWSLVPLKLHVKSLELTPSILEALPAPPPFVESANRNSVMSSNRMEGGSAGDNSMECGRDEGSGYHGWSTVSIHWSRCSQFILAAYIQQRKAWPDGKEVMLPGLVILWRTIEAQVEGFLRLRSRVAHASLSPRDPRRGTLCCADGTSYIVDFPAAAPSPASAPSFSFTVAEKASDNIVETVVETVTSDVAKVPCKHVAENVFDKKTDSPFVGGGQGGSGDVPRKEGASTDTIRELSPAMLSTLPSLAAKAGESAGTGERIGATYYVHDDYGVLPRPSVAPGGAAAAVVSARTGGIKPSGGGRADGSAKPSLLLLPARRAAGSAVAAVKVARQAMSGAIERDTLSGGIYGAEKGEREAPAPHNIVFPWDKPKVSCEGEGSPEGGGNGGPGGEPPVGNSEGPVHSGVGVEHGDVNVTVTALVTVGASTRSSVGGGGNDVVFRTSQAAEVLRRLERGGEVTKSGNEKLPLRVTIDRGAGCHEGGRGGETLFEQGCDSGGGTRSGVTIDGGASGGAARAVSMYGENVPERPADGGGSGGGRAIKTATRDDYGIVHMRSDTATGFVGVEGHANADMNRIKEGGGARGSVGDRGDCHDRRCARTRMIWDPIRQLQLFDNGGGRGDTLPPFFAATDGAATPKTGIKRNPAGPSTGLVTCPGADLDSNTGSRNDSVKGVGTGPGTRTGSAVDTVVDAAASCSPGNCGAGVGSFPGSGGGRPFARGAVQAGRAVWGSDGETVFLLNHEGNLLKVKVCADGCPTLLAKTDLLGGASPSTLQLTPEGDKVLLATATKGLCLLPTDDLDLARGEMFGENFGIRGSKNRFWGVAVLGDIHGTTYAGGGKRRLTVIGSPSRTRDEKTDVFFFDRPGGQPERVDTPRREGVLSLACSPLRPMLVFICPTGEVYFREQMLKTDFPGPWYPSGYVLIDNNVDYLEAEDQLDTVVTISFNGEVLSKNQAHEVVVPWQHETVTEEQCFEGHKMEAVDIEGGRDTEIWTDMSRDELRWIPPHEGSWSPEGGRQAGSATPRGSPRGGVQESLGGPLARLLDATPSLVKEARKRNRGSVASEADAAAKRRRMLPKMLEVLALKQKKCDEEAIKRKSKLEESRAKGKRLKKKKAAVTTVAADARSTRNIAEKRDGAELEEIVGAPTAEPTKTADRKAAANVAAAVATVQPPAGELQAWLAAEWTQGVPGPRSGGYYHRSASDSRDGSYYPHMPSTGENFMVGEPREVWCSPVGLFSYPCAAAAGATARVAGTGGGAGCHCLTSPTSYGGFSFSIGRGGGATGGAAVVPPPLTLSSWQQQLLSPSLSPMPSVSKPRSLPQQQPTITADHPNTAPSSTPRNTKLPKNSVSSNTNIGNGGSIESGPAYTMSGAAGSTESSWGPAGLILDGTPVACGAPGSTDVLFEATTSTVGATAHSGESGIVVGGFYRGDFGGVSGRQHGRRQSVFPLAVSTNRGGYKNDGRRPTPSLSHSGSPIHDGGGASGSFGNPLHSDTNPNRHAQYHQGTDQYADDAVASGVVTAGAGEVGGYSTPSNAVSATGAAAAAEVARRASMLVGSCHPPSFSHHLSVLPSRTSPPPSAVPSPTPPSACLSPPPSPPSSPSPPHPGAGPYGMPNKSARRQSASLSPAPHTFRGVSIVAGTLAHGRPKSPPVSAGLPLPMGVCGSIGSGSVAVGAAGFALANDWRQGTVIGLRNASGAEGVGRRQGHDAWLDAGTAASGGAVGAGVEMFAISPAQRQQQQQLQDSGHRGGGGIGGSGEGAARGRGSTAISYVIKPPAALVQGGGAGGVAVHRNQPQDFRRHRHGREYGVCYPFAAEPFGPSPTGEDIRGMVVEGVVPPSSVGDDVAEKDVGDRDGLA